jgi:glutamate-ammonia-ligase adenylyltransferase
MEWLAKMADPDATLNQFVRFVQAYGLRSLLFELLVANPRLLELLLKTFDASRFAGDLLIRRPQLLEDITRDPAFDQPRSVAENLRRLEPLGANPNDLDPIRAYRQRQLLRIVLRDVLGLANPGTTFAELSDLAEACLVFTARLVANDQVTVIALGKFGGGELSYGADLDVLFIGNDDRATQNFVTAVARPTAEGNIWTLDARLRPEGEKGPLVCSLETYQWYYANRARPWELQALTRARAITGPLQNKFMDVAKRAWRQAGQQPDLLARIDGMLERVRRERGSGSDFADLKTGCGGIIETEFLVQALQMRENIWEPNWERTIDQLQQQGQMSDSEIGKLKLAYALLRRCELVLRRYENRGVSTLPNNPDEQRKFAVRLGYDNFETFRHDYVEAREAIHTVYERRIGNQSVTAFLPSAP